MSSPADGLIGARRWELFAVTWAAAVLFHLAGNTRAASAPVEFCVGAAAVAVLARPRDVRLAAGLAVAVLVSVWAEAPLLSNHWLLHGLVALLVLGAVAAGRNPADSFAHFVGPARLTLLAFYGFAAFAKLNHDFFDSSVSCAVFYLRESAQSWGLGSMAADLPSGVGLAVAVAVAGVELGVAALLALRSTRRYGVVLGLGFHFVLAVDRSHEFFDFSAILVCLFLLFLADDPTEELLGLLTRSRTRIEGVWKSGPELLRLGALAGAALVVGVVAGQRDWPAPTLLRDIGVAVWLVYGLAAIVLAGWVVRVPAPADVAERRRSPWLLLVPLLSFGNGLAPYLEVKSSASWNMYANLALVDGSSNHLLIRRTVPLTDAYADLVRITDTNDAGLRSYVDSSWSVPRVQLVDYLADHPGSWARGIMGDATVRFDDTGPARPTWRQKFQIFRAVDTEGPVACQPSFGPAR